jgi:hypothetical protein
MQKEMDKTFLMPNHDYELDDAIQCMPFDDVRQIFAMYEQALKLKDNLIANLLEKNRQLEQEKQQLKQDTQRIPLLEEQIKFLEQHPTTTYIYNAPHYQAERIEKHTDIEVGSQSISNGGIGISYSKPAATSTSTAAQAAPTTTQPQTYDAFPEETTASLTFDQRILSESTPVQVFYEKVSAKGFFAMPAITCLTDDSKIQLLYEITKQSNTPFATAMIHYLQYYEYIQRQFEGFSKEQFYRHISMALETNFDTIKKNFLSISSTSEEIKQKYHAWNFTTEVVDFYNALEKI